MLAMALAMLVQGVPGPPGDEDTPAARRAECARPEGEITVCAEDPESFRLRPVPPRGKAGIGPAQVRLPGGATGTATAEKGGGNAVVPRAMVTLAIPF